MVTAHAGALHSHHRRGAYLVDDVLDVVRLQVAGGEDVVQGRYKTISWILGRANGCGSLVAGTMRAIS